MKRLNRPKVYYNVHQWLRYNYGKPEICENKKCDKTSKVFDWALKKGKEHLKIRKNYLRLCRKCHMNYDWTSEKTKRIWDIAHTPEANLKRRLILKGMIRSEETKIKMRERWRKYRVK